MPNFLNNIISSLTVITKRLTHVGDVSEGTFGSFYYQYASFDFSGHPVHQVVIDLPSGIGGEIQITPADGQRALWDNSNRLESIEFNERMDVYASDRALAFRVLSPDFMAWLLDLPRMPQIFFVGKRCFVAWVESDLSKETEVKTADTIVTFVRRSGALESLKA